MGLLLALRDVGGLILQGVRGVHTDFWLGNLHFPLTGSFRTLLGLVLILTLTFTSAPLLPFLLSPSALFIQSLQTQLSEQWKFFASHLVPVQATMSSSSIPPGSTAEAPASSTSQYEQPRKMTALERNNMKWESHKEEIQDIYIDQDKTLKDTMQWFKQNRGIDWR